MSKNLLFFVALALPHLGYAEGWSVTNVCVSVNATPKIEITLEDFYASNGDLIEAKVSLNGAEPELATINEKPSDIDPNFTVREWKAKGFRVEGFFENLTGRRNFTGHYLVEDESVKLSCYF